MSSLDIALLIIIASVVVIGSLLFFLSGIYKVKKNQVMVIEKAGEFYKLYEEGTYFLMPLMYKRKGVYTTSKLEKNIHIDGLREMILTYQVIDVKKYHYYDGDVSKCIEDTYQKSEEMSEEILINSLSEIGVKFISIRAK